MKLAVGALLVFLLLQISFRCAVGKLSARITDGKDAEPGQFPYQVSIELKFLWRKYKHICGGTIINENYVLTAGQCTKGFFYKYGKLRVKAGKHYLKNDDEFVQTSNVVKKIPHENFHMSIFPQPDDIGLLKLETPLVFNERVQAIELPEPGQMQTGEAVMTGWGSTSKGLFPKLAKVLQWATVPILDQDSCKDYWARNPQLVPIPETMLCSGPIGGSVASCTYDTGGPFAQYVDGKAVMVGITSWGVLPCGADGAPSVYTRVSSYIDWINDRIDE